MIAKDSFRNMMEEANDGNPTVWRPKSGDLLLGRLVAFFPSVRTDYGFIDQAHIREEDSGRLYAVWIGPTVLRAQWEAETPVKGERVAIKYFGQRTPREGDHAYHVYRVEVDRRRTESSGADAEPTDSEC